MRSSVNERCAPSSILCADASNNSLAMALAVNPLTQMPQKQARAQLLRLQQLLQAAAVARVVRHRHRTN